VVLAGASRIRNQFAGITLGLLVIGAGFIVDVTTGRDLSLSLVYVAAVALMAWMGSFRIGLVGAVAGATAVLLDGLSNSVTTGIAVSNAVTALVLLAATTAVVDHFHGRLIREASRARFDTLTGLSNRRECEERSAIELARLRRHPGSLSVAFLDFDGLKQINDVHGHAAGDAALVHLATSAQGVLRPTDLLSRVGGDEFVLLLPDTDYEDAATVTRRIQQRLAEPDGGPPASVTVGLVTWRSAPQSVEQMFGEADALMYSAKRKRSSGDHFESLVVG
jgi:diguanylate cyclase (GGDEF)-like protein